MPSPLHICQSLYTPKSSASNCGPHLGNSSRAKKSWGGWQNASSRPSCHLLGTSSMSPSEPDPGAQDNWGSSSHLTDPAGEVQKIAWDKHPREAAQSEVLPRVAMSMQSLKGKQPAEQDGCLSFLPQPCLNTWQKKWPHTQSLTHLPSPK
jgi:hypothetical protein